MNHRKIIGIHQIELVQQEVGNSPNSGRNPYSFTAREQCGQMGCRPGPAACSLDFTYTIGNKPWKGH